LHKKERPLPETWAIVLGGVVQYVVEQLNQTANTTLKLMTSCYKALDKVHSQPFSMVQLPFSSSQ